MLYLAIDQHSKQLTVNVRDEAGQIVQRKQVSTRGEAPREFLAQLSQRAGAEGYVAIVEVCGFNDWLLDLLPHCGCRETVLVQPGEPGKRKTDRRDANQLGEVLWVNRHRLLAGQRVQGLRRVNIPGVKEREHRRLAALRHRVGRELTRVINRVWTVLRRRNLQHECPTKTIQSQKARVWLTQVALCSLDRLELDQLLVRWQLLAQHRSALEATIAERLAQCPDAQLLTTLPSAGAFMALGLAAHVGEVTRFPRPRSLANYWGLTPSCRNSGEKNQRLGSISKEGSNLARFLLGQLVMHVLKRDAHLRAWYLGIKRRRGAKIARVAVMRRLTTIIWHMLTHREAYRRGGVSRTEVKARERFRGGRDQQDPQFPSPAPPTPFPSSLFRIKENAKQDRPTDRRSERSASSEDRDPAQACSSRWPVVRKARQPDPNAACGRDGRTDNWCPLAQSGGTGRCAGSIHEGMDWGAVGRTGTRTTHANPLNQTVTRSTVERINHFIHSPDTKKGDLAQPSSNYAPHTT